MLSLGNFFFAQLGRGPAGGAGAAGGGGSLKESYKFYFHVLNEDATNVFAANGLGMVCAEKGETDAAREIFAKVRACCTATRLTALTRRAGQGGAQGAVRGH